MFLYLLSKYIIKKIYINVICFTLIIDSIKQKIYDNDTIKIGGIF